MTRLSKSPADTPDAMRVGTLTYTKVGLLTLFGWMLWGDFCFHMMEMIIPRLLPIQLERLGASSTIIGILVSSIPAVMNFFIVPVVSFRSDRFRSKWGRRIPFLLFPTPFLTLFLVMLGYSDGIGAWLHSSILGRWIGLTPEFTTIALIAVLVVGFQFFNMFVASVYYYLFNDVVPKAYLGRFMAMFRVVGTLAGFVFHRYVLGWAEGHMREVYLGVSLLYFAAFIMMCLRVKEGDYPPPPPTDQPGLMGSIRTYFRECYSHRFYLFFFLGMAFWNMGDVVVAFYWFFADSVGLTLDQFGKVLGWTSLLSALLLYPYGLLVDRVHPLRMLILARLLIIPFNLVFFFLVHDYTSYLIASLMFVPLTAVSLAANLPTFMVLLPKDRYGQFCSAQAMLNSIALVCGGALAGLFLDLLGNNYRYLFIWMMGCQLAGVGFLILVYRKWTALGGKDGYQPPGFEQPSSAD